MAFRQFIKEVEDKQKKERDRRRQLQDSRVSSASTFKDIAELEKHHRLDRKKLSDKIDRLGGESRADCDRLLKKFDKWLKELDEFIEQHS